MVTVAPPYKYIILQRRDRKLTLYSANPLCPRLCFISFMSAHSPLTRTRIRKRMTSNI